MSAISGTRGGGLLASALARAQSWLIEPIEPRLKRVEIRARPVVAVVGLARGSGATTTARALAVELARRDSSGAAAVMGESNAGRVPVAHASATRLARALGAAGGATVCTSGRLCLVAGGDPATVVAAGRHLAPLVIDIEHGGAAGVAASLADHVAVVASPSTEPALSDVVTASLARVGPEPLLLVNRVGAGEPEASRAAHRLPESRAGARLALAGGAPRGLLSAAVGRLADDCEMPRAEW